ncbi:DUF418 domain-containing protein [Sphingomonas astaxanthinifaciens]|uniref:DUF418 domain-containing protein n=1 Tax=Sphingomonas astaxanthinifaciens DSM 22298 TaxID=1123267 RepID=A0ABQ5Z5H1_9SPHN|nr:DUF418 domain-containing protein [Sphingomonas astaxanthinifaciens]GLR47271.1 hypothetical protein GCM10007925_09820 [Sphingomonas astaxanthinifaciens DSM 22298]
MNELGQGERIASLDVIRGVAVMGIFSVNVIAFAMIEGAYFNPAAYGGHTGADLLLWAVNMVVIDGKMRSLFSMLFGASMLLVIERAEAGGRSGAAVHYRRMVVLLLFGLAHFYLIWFGDILAAYALTGMLAFVFRKRSPRSLAIWGSVFIALNMALFAAVATSMATFDKAAHLPGATAEQIRSWNQFGLMFYPFPETIAKDIAVHADLGTRLHHMVTRRLAEPFVNSLVTGPETLGLMLLGMAGFKSGFLTGRWDLAAYRRVAVWGLTIGAIAFTLIVVADIATHFYVPVVFGLFIVASAPFRVIMAFGFAALIILLARAGGPLSQRLAAAGRCAFSNYLGTSIIAAFIFYGWGLGLYAQLSRWQAWAVAVPLVWAIMLLWSKPWLERFNYGPLEWAWRSLSRGRLEPMRRRPATLPATA